MLACRVTNAIFTQLDVAPQNNNALCKRLVISESLECSFNTLRCNAGCQGGVLSMMPA